MIILVVIAIVVLVIIVFLVARSGGDANNATKCPSKGGVCVDLSKGCTDYITDDNGQIACPNSQVCCNPLSVVN
jgi:hypothetical protein